MLRFLLRGKNKMLMDLLIHEKASFRRWAEESEPFSFFFFLLTPGVFCRYMWFLRWLKSLLHQMEFTVKDWNA